MLIEETPPIAKTTVADRHLPAPPDDGSSPSAAASRPGMAREEESAAPRPDGSELDQADQFLSAAEASALLGVKPATLYAYASRGWLRSYKQGIRRQRFYSRRELERLLEVRANTTNAGAQADTMITASGSDAPGPDRVGQATPGDSAIELALPDASDWVGER